VIHNCAVMVIIGGDPRYVLKCDDCDLRVLDNDGERLDALFRQHRRETSHLVVAPRYPEGSSE